MQKEANFKPANFEHAYEYLEFVEKNNWKVDWSLVQLEPALYADLIILGVMHKVVKGKCK